jgi:hypothetical protein
MDLDPGNRQEGFVATLSTFNDDDSFIISYENVPFYYFGGNVNGKAELSFPMVM